MQFSYIVNEKTVEIFSLQNNNNDDNLKYIFVAMNILFIKADFWNPVQLRYVRICITWMLFVYALGTRCHCFEPKRIKNQIDTFMSICSNTSEKTGNKSFFLRF